MESRGCRIFSADSVAHLNVSKLRFDHSKRMLHLGSYAGFDLLDTHFDRIHANVRFHVVIPLVTLLGLMHLRATRTRAVFGQSRGQLQSGIKHRARLELQPTLKELALLVFRQAAAKSYCSNRRIVLSSGSRSQPASIRANLGSSGMS